MTRFGMELWERGRGKPVQYFTYGPLQFNVNRAAVLAANRKKYQPECQRPIPDWIGPFIEIDERYVDRCNKSQPVIFARLPLPGHPPRLLIDGNHRVAHALKYQKWVRTIVLDLEDTLKVVTGPHHLIEQIKQEGRRLGLLHQTGAVDGPLAG